MAKRTDKKTDDILRADGDAPEETAEAAPAEEVAAPSKAPEDKAIAMDIGGNPGEQGNGDTVLVWSALPHSYTIRRVVEKFGTTDLHSPQRHAYRVQKFKLVAGPNRVPRDLWVWATANLQGVQKRIEHNFLVAPSHGSKKAPGPIATKLESYAAGQGLGKVDAFGLLWDRPAKDDPADKFDANLARRGMRSVDENSGRGGVILAGS